MKRQTGRWNRLSSYKTDIRDIVDGKVVTYHKTDIVEFTGNDIILNHGGWMGVTTKRKINQAANQFGLDVSVYQRKHEWYVATKAVTFAWPARSNSVVIDRVTGLPAFMSFAEMAHAIGKAA